MNACPKVAGPATLVAKLDAPEGGILMMEGNYSNINLAHMVFTRHTSSRHTHTHTRTHTHTHTHTHKHTRTHTHIYTHTHSTHTALSA